jgi:hypothetical protein
VSVLILMKGIGAHGYGRSELGYVSGRGRGFVRDVMGDGLERLSWMLEVRVDPSTPYTQSRFVWL